MVESHSIREWAGGRIPGGRTRVPPHHVWIAYRLYETAVDNIKLSGISIIPQFHYY